MKLLIATTLLLSLSDPHVFASVLASPYQTVYMWYAYRMDIEAYGKRADSIAPLCVGTAPKNTCYFDEFVRYLQRAGKTLDAGQRTSVGTNFWPDAVEAARELSGLIGSDGKNFVPNQDPHKIFKTGTFTVANPRLNDILKLVTDKIQDVRIGLGDNRVGISKEGLDEARQAMVGLHDARLADTGQDYIDTLNDYLKTQKKRTTTVETHNPTAIDGSTYLDVDIDATKAKDANFAADFKDFQTWMGQQSRKGKSTLANVKIHWDTIQGVQKLEARIWGGRFC